MVYLDSTRRANDDLAGQAFVGEAIYPHNINSREIASLKGYHNGLCQCGPCLSGRGYEAVLLFGEKVLGCTAF